MWKLIPRSSVSSISTLHILDLLDGLLEIKFSKAAGGINGPLINGYNKVERTAIMVIARGFELQTRKYAVAVNQRLLIVPLKSDIYVDWRFETYVVLSFLMIAASNWIVYLDSENLGEQILRR